MLIIFSLLICEFFILEGQKIKPKNAEEVCSTVVVEVVQLSQFLFRTKYIDLSPQGIYSET